MLNGITEHPMVYPSRTARAESAIFLKAPGTMSVERERKREGEGVLLWWGTFELILRKHRRDTKLDDGGEFRKLLPSEYVLDTSDDEASTWSQKRGIERRTGRSCSACVVFRRDDLQI